MDPDEDPERDEAETADLEDAADGTAAPGSGETSRVTRPAMTPEWHAEVPWYLGLGAFVAVVMWWQIARTTQPLWAWALGGAGAGLLLAWLRETLPYWIVRLLDRRE